MQKITQGTHHGLSCQFPRRRWSGHCVYNLWILIASHRCQPPSSHLRLPSIWRGKDSSRRSKPTAQLCPATWGAYPCTAATVAAPVAAAVISVSEMPLVFGTNFIDHSFGVQCATGLCASFLVLLLMHLWCLTPHRRYQNLWTDSVERKVCECVIVGEAAFFSAGWHNGHWLRVIALYDET